MLESGTCMLMYKCGISWVLWPNFFSRNVRTFCSWTPMKTPCSEMSLASLAFLTFVNKNIKLSIVKVEKSFIWAKLRTIVWKTASQITLRNCSREAWFSTWFYILSEQRTLNESWIYFFKVSTKTDQYLPVSQCGLGTWKGSLIIKRLSSSIGVPGREAFHLLFFLT